MELSNGVKKVLTSVFAATAFGGLAYTTYDSMQHDRQVQAGFRDAVLQDPSPHLMIVTTNSVTREGFVNQGVAYTGEPRTAFIIASTPESACWYTTLRVTKGQENLPFWQKVFGGSESEEMFANQALDGMTCAPTGNGKTIGNMAKPAAPAPALGK